MGSNARRVARAAALSISIVVAIPAIGCGDSGGDEPPVDATAEAPGDGALDARDDRAGETLADAPIGPRDATVDDRWFEELGESAGLTTVRSDAQFGDFHGRMSGGVCVLDYDRDGFLDVALAAPLTAGGLRLHRGAPGMKLVDVTDASGLSGIDAGGCLSFDLEGDGDADLVALGFGAVRLLRNDGGTFSDATRLLPAAFDASSHFMSAVAFDADGDGMLDLAIADYGAYREPPPELDCVVTCPLNNGFYQGGAALLLLQRASGSFEDVTDRLGRVGEPALVLLATDLDEDRRLDLFVGNDSPRTNDRYWANGGAGAFTDVAVTLGVAFNGRKNGVSSMSAFDADVDGDGHLDLLESSWEDDRDTLFHCAGGKCVDVAEDVELFRTPKNLRWGQAMVDFDDDGVLEILESVGHVYRDSDLLKPPDAGAAVFGPVSAPPLLWHRARTDAPFAIAAATAGLSVPTAGRGLVVVDLDGDGALDAIVGTALGRPLVLRGVHGPRGHWLGVELAGKGKNSRGIGARIVVRAAGKSWTSIEHAGHGYRSSVDAPLHFGLGDTARVDAIEVTWPSGARSIVTEVLGDRVLTITEP
jgi:hypothetical protein